MKQTLGVNSIKRFSIVWSFPGPRVNKFMWASMNSSTGTGTITNTTTILDKFDNVLKVNIFHAKHFQTRQRERVILEQVSSLWGFAIELMFRCGIACPIQLFSPPCVFGTSP